MEKVPSRGHKASPQRGLGVGCKRCSIIKIAPRAECTCAGAAHKLDQGWLPTSCNSGKTRRAAVCSSARNRVWGRPVRVLCFVPLEPVLPLQSAHRRPYVAHIAPASLIASRILPRLMVSAACNGNRTPARSEGTGLPGRG